MTVKGIPKPLQDFAYLQGSSSAVTLVHEPEAAAVTACCDPLRSWPAQTAKPGQVWIVVDGGGGTVDIAMFKAVHGDREGEVQLSEVFRSICLLKGSSLLDLQAEEQLIMPQLRDPSAWEAWKAENPGLYLQQMEKWERVKQGFTGDRKARLYWNVGVIELLRPGLGNQGYIDIAAADMKSRVFDPVLDEIVDEVRHMLRVPRTSDRRTGADVMLVVGGLGCNAYFRQRLQRLQQHEGLVASVCAPADVARKVVVLGNTLHLQNPRTIMERCSRLTYGLALAVPPSGTCFQQGELRPEPKGGQRLCHNHFSPIVRAGEVLRVDREIRQVLHPQRGASCAVLEVWATDRDVVPDHADPRLMQRVGQVKVPVEKVKGCFKTQSSRDYKIEVCFKFGVVHIEVQAYDVTHGRRRQATVHFVADAIPSRPVICRGN